DDGLLAVIGSEGDTSAVRRHTWSLVRSRREGEGNDSSPTVREAKVRAPRGLPALEGRHGLLTRNEKADLWEAGLGSACTAPAEAFQHLHRLARQRRLLCIERNGE